MDLPPSSFGTNKGKSKGKHVGFSDDVEITRLPSPPEPEESDLTDLTEVENSINKLKPSPRRLRSKGSVSRLSHDKSRPDDAHETARRITPMRKAKGKVGNLNESTDEEAEEEDELVSDAQEDEDESSSSSDEEEWHIGVHDESSNSNDSASGSDDSEMDVDEEPHSTKPQLPPPETGTTLFVRNVPFEATEDELRTLYDSLCLFLGHT